MKTAIFDRAKALLTSVHPVNAQTYLVKSQRGEGVYRVDLEASTCTCPAYTYGLRPCKHLLAATLYKKLGRNGSSHSSQAKTETSG